MTEENVNYITDEMLLRNQFCGEKKYGIVEIPKFNFKDEDFNEVKLIGFDAIKSGKDEHFNSIIHSEMAGVVNS